MITVDLNNLCLYVVVECVQQAVELGSLVVHHRELEADIHCLPRTPHVPMLAFKIFHCGDAEHVIPFSLELWQVQVPKACGDSLKQCGDPFGGILLPLGVCKGRSRNQLKQALVECLDAFGSLVREYSGKSLEEI